MLSFIGDLEAKLASQGRNSSECATQVIDLIRHKYLSLHELLETSGIRRHNIIYLKAVLTPLALKDVEKIPNPSKCVEFGVNLVRPKQNLLHVS